MTYQPPPKNAYALRHGCCWCGALPVAEGQHDCQRCMDIVESYPKTRGEGTIAKLKAAGVEFRPAFLRVLAGGKYRHPFDDDLSPDESSPEVEPPAPPAPAVPTTKKKIEFL